MHKIDIRSLTPEDMEGFIRSLDEKSYRAAQVYDWINRKHVTTFAEMSNLSKSLRSKLEENAYISVVEMERKIVSSKDNTIKYLFRLENDTIIESVFMTYAYGNAVCISTQAGCRMGCRFCASGEDGLERNLTAGEMCAQVYEMARDAGRVSNVVLMGSGEPLDNYENVIRFFRIICSKEGMGIGRRHITVSTCGIPFRIRELAELGLPINLAVSLHAPNDAIRRQSMPIANRYNMDEILDACRFYAKKTSRRVTFEYALIPGLNDSEACAAELGRRIKQMLCHVNLIPVNRARGLQYEAHEKKGIERFAAVLQSMGVETTIRRELGSDINAACGQLKVYYIKNR